MNETPEAGLLNRSALAAYLGVSPSTIKNMARDGELPPSVTIRGRQMFRREAVERWLKDQEAAS